MKSVSIARLEEKFKGEGRSRFDQIASLGGFGSVSAQTAEGGLSADADLDLTGVLDPENKAVSEANKNKIRELAGVDGEFGASSSADKMKKEK